MSIDSEAEKDLALTDEDAEKIVGGKKLRRKPPVVAPNRPPLYVRQTLVYGSVEVSANSGDDDCAPENGGATT